MGYAQYNFDLFQGDTAKPIFSFYSITKDEDGKEIKTPVEVTGCSFLMTLKSKHDSIKADELSTENGRIQLGNSVEGGDFVPVENKNDASNAIRLIFNHKNTTQYTNPNYLYELFRIKDDEYELIMHGVINVTRSITYERK